VRKRKRRMNDVQRLAPPGPSLTDKADTAELLYKTLLRVAPEDIDGIQKAYVDVEPDGITVTDPRGSDVALKAFYGLDATSVADLQNPFPMVPQRDGPPEFSAKQNFDRSLLRQALRRLVDDA
jgi:hypothetical protein